MNRSLTRGTVRDLTGAVQVILHMQFSIPDFRQEELRVSTCLKLGSEEWKNGELLLNVVCTGRDATAASGPVRMEKLAARPVHALVCVSAEEVALRLEQVRRQPLSAVAVEERERRREGRRWHAVLDRFNDGAPPRGLIFVQHPAEEIVEQQIG